jgi:hypothetical protein
MTITYQAIPLRELLSADAILHMMKAIMEDYSECESIEQVVCMSQDLPEDGLWADFAVSPEPVAYTDDNYKRTDQRYWITFRYHHPDPQLCTWGFDLDEHHGITTGDYRNFSCWAD